MRERIKEVALRQFAAHGIDAVSVRDIAAEVGMKPSNLYAHFRGRDALVAELFLEGYQDYAAILSKEAGKGGTYRVRLERMIRRACVLHDTDGIRFRFLMLSQHSALSDVPDGTQTVASVLEAVLTQGIKAGEFPPHPPALLAAMVMGIVLQPANALLYGVLSGGLTGIAPQLADSCLAVVMRPPVKR